MTIARDKITEIFCMADDFCHIYDRFIKINGLAPKRDKSKRKYHRDSTLSDAEVITIMTLFHLMGYKCLKHFYLNEVYKNMTTCFLTPSPIIASLNWSERLLYLSSCSSRSAAWAAARGSALSIVRLCASARTNASISTGFSRDLPSGASARWDGSMASNCTSFATKRETS